MLYCSPSPSLPSPALQTSPSCLICFASSAWLSPICSAPSSTCASETLVNDQKGGKPQSAVGTLVKRKSRYLLMTRLEDCSADATLEAFTRKFRHMPACVRKTLTYDQEEEMAHHEELAKRVKIDVYFANPHSPWLRPTNENTNGLIREYLPRGLDLAPISQGYLNTIARQLNDRPRKCLGFATSAKVFAEEIIKLKKGVALKT